MRPRRRRNLQALVFIMVAIAAATAIILYQLRANIDYFYTPSDLTTNDLPPDARIRVGGYVVNGSLSYNKDGSAQFLLTDNLAEVEVIYKGVLPALFAEGDQAVVIGTNGDRRIVAIQVLAKHDENYRPPELKELK